MAYKDEILKGIEDRELRLYLAKGLDKAYDAIKKYSPRFSDFSDPVKAVMLKGLAERNIDVQVRLFGGYEYAERVMAGFFPEYAPEEDFPLKAVEISFNAEYSKKLTHRDFLGSVLGLGLDRGKIGDIIVHDGGALVFAQDGAADFIIYNLEKVGHTKVSCRALEDISKYTDTKEGTEAVGTVASPRIDAILGKVFNISRGSACEYIKAGKVFVNWTPVESVSKRVGENDVITLRGKGRVKLLEFMGNTKKDKLIIRYVKFN